MLQHTERHLSRQTPVCDHSGTVLYRADRIKAQALLLRADIDIIGTHTRIKAIRFRGPDPAHMMGGSHHKRGIGTPHRNENYYNPKNVWTIDRIPVTYHGYFVAIVTDRLVAI